MKHAACCAVLLAVIFVVSGCLSAPVIPPSGLIYTGFKAPLDLDQSKTPVAPKMGTSSSTSILGMVAWGDASINAAALEGGIQTIESADYSYTSVLLGLYQHYTTIVYGN